MKNNTPQPLDSIMAKHGLSNADLVNASTEQLSFKMVQKGRKGKRLTTNIQDKILTAIRKAKPELQLNRRDLFRYEPSVDVIQGIEKAMSLARAKKVKYPQFVDLLAEAGIVRYSVNVAANEVTFFGTGGEAHIVKGPAISENAPGRFSEEGIRAAIEDAQKEVIDHPTFLKRIYESGIAHYETNIRERRIAYKGEGQSYKEKIPTVSPQRDSCSPRG
jgi:uncharacterized protein YbcV (DUF1398 family)